MLTTDLQMLVASGVLTLLLAMLPAIARLRVPGSFQWNMGNRDRPLEGEPAWAGRASRAHANMLENLTVFAIVVLVVHVTGKANAASALGATLFLIGRLAHAVLYIVGIPYLRTLAFGVSLAGLLRVLWQLF